MDDLPAPHRKHGASSRGTSEDRRPDVSPDGAERSASTSAGTLVATLRGMVGRRDSDSGSVGFALAALDAVGYQLSPALASVSSGDELVALAESHDALSSGPPLSGDLAVFDVPGTGDEPEVVVGVVVERAERGRQHTAEVIYLAFGIVRRGFVTPAEPTTSRDPEGRALNTFMRHHHKQNAGDDYLAGQRFRTYIRIDRL